MYSAPFIFYLIFINFIVTFLNNIRIMKSSIHIILTIILNINKMENEVIITGVNNVTKEGVTLLTNIPASLKTGNVKGTTIWVSWDKIGTALLDNYTEKCDVADLKKLRGEK